jgi:hypothetical protein
MPTEINQIIAGSRNIVHKKGDTLRPIQITLKLNGTPIDLTGNTYILKIFSASDATETALVTFSTSSGITIDPTAGQITISQVSALDTLAEGTYEYNLKETNGSGNITTIVQGLFLNNLSN